MNDAELMRRALLLAHRGLGRVSPNPAVGAVLVKNGRVVGEGFHQYQQVKHAEVIACEQAGTEATGASLYINLEPCAHQGRTRPCCEYLAGKKIARVVAAMQDPNPLVNGRGFRSLKEAGIEVEVGLLEAEAASLNESYTKFITLGIPFVTVKAAMSLDGKIASASGTVREHFSGPDSNTRNEALRLQVDAIAVGANTVLADDPLLTYRGKEKRRRPLIRILLDPHARVDPQCRLFQDPTPIWWVRPRAGRPLPAQVSLIEPGSEYASSWKAILTRMTAEKMYHLLIEGGGETNAGALMARIVDKVIFICCPKLVGGRETTGVIGGEGFRPPISLKKMTVSQVGSDFWVEGYL
ncbi:MAG TPA: bifunctional diaminohydroxyphosphoribosylaminopyrimidine deaminase/5-amino-6-(5-phosphoribosylamino)uracil reductase RibD [Acidobacteriota bacterium]|nr:bifunctional diaminohydroxyphosphoribosylaminopyrimidine deaminase/5-amino-6-(5-phosphoribosylamino)uracil reductase RibD [Acidobacteriota bacterium]